MTKAMATKHAKVRTETVVRPKPLTTAEIWCQVDQARPSEILEAVGHRQGAEVIRSQFKYWLMRTPPEGYLFTNWKAAFKLFLEQNSWVRDASQYPAEAPNEHPALRLGSPPVKLWLQTGTAPNLEL